MQVQRCPECGGRLKTNYCDICLRKVPFKGVPAKQTFQHHEGSSAHRTERDHECVSFDEPKKQIPKTGKTLDSGMRKIVAAVVVFALVMLLPIFFNLMEESSGVGSEPVPEPEYQSVEVFTQDGNVPAIQPTELYNDGAIIVTADFADLYYDDYTVFMTVINESPSDIIVGTDLLSVNGYMHSSSLYAEVDAGETVQGSLQLYTWELEQAGIEEVAELAFCLNIYDQHDYEDIARSELITIETEIADSYAQPEFLDGRELYRDEDLAVRLVSTSLYCSDCELQLYMENLSSQTTGVSVSNSQINGQELDGSFWNILRPGTKVLTTLYLSDSEVDSLDRIEEISLDLNLEYMKDWYVDSTRIANITFNPNTL